jgi:hypothetical protein
MTMDAMARTMTMKNISIETLDWDHIGADLDKEGYALLPRFLDAAQAKALAALASEAGAQGQCLSLERLELGRGDVWRLPQPLPDPIAAWRVAFYEQLVPIANRWADIMGTDFRYPATLEEFLRENREVGQTGQLTALSYLREGDYLALHQNTQGKRVFPLQLVILLCEPDIDFTGGEFVMTEQRPRMQSRPMVLPLRQGDAALITVAHRPFKGSKGYYRVNLKHAISRVRSGERVGIELLFHDAQHGLIGVG